MVRWEGSADKVTHMSNVSMRDMEFSLAGRSTGGRRNVAGEGSDGAGQA
jgi:hypothetical protein